MMLISVRYCIEETAVVAVRTMLLKVTARSIRGHQEQLHPAYEHFGDAKTKVAFEGGYPSRRPSSDAQIDVFMEDIPGG